MLEGRVNTTMYNFFDFYTKIPKESAMKNFGFQHISCIIIIFMLIYICLKFLKKSSCKVQNIVIKVSAIFVPILELSHNIWLYLCADASLPELLSLHICGMQMYFIPLAVFTKALIFKDFVFASSVLGGFLAIVFPSGITDTYPLWHFQTLQTFAYHALLIFVPVAILLTTDYRPTLKRFHKVLLLFFGIAGLAFIVDIIWNQNYLFLVTAPDMPLLHNMQIMYGTPTYLIFTFFALLFCCILIHLPFDLKKLKENNK